MRKINIPVFVPHLGCPHDCAFCNQRRITGEHAQMDAARAQRLIEAAAQTLPGSGHARAEIAFFGGSFTAIDPKLQEALLAVAYQYLGSGCVHGIRISTRPDCIDAESLDRLKRFGVTAIELGVQSTSDSVLSKSGRGHRAEASFAASKRILERGFELGLQMMLGLPGSGWESEYQTAVDIAAMRPATVRIYPTLVLKDSPLCESYAAGAYQPLSLDEAVERCAKLYTFFHKQKIAVIRMGLMASEEIAPGHGVVAGPFHPAFGELVHSRIFLHKMLALLDGYAGEQAEVAVHPRDLSKAAGHRRENLKRIDTQRGIKVRLKPCEAVEVGECLWYNKP